MQKGTMNASKNGENNDQRGKVAKVSIANYKMRITSYKVTEEP